MYAIEFQTRVTNGSIEIPGEFKDKLAGLVRVIVLTKEKAAENDMISQLLVNPIRLADFEPLTREEIYEQQ